MNGRTVRLYLVDGIPTGMITAEIMNWTGKFTVSPRSQLADLAKRDEVKRTGLYILIGSNPKEPSQEIVYIGESDNIWTRLTQHNKRSDKDFWEKTVIITSKDENLTKSHVRYLESRLIQVANKANRALVCNGTNPDPTNLPEPDIADMEFFLEQIQMILPVLGFTFTNSLSKNDVTLNLEEANNNSPVFTMNYSGAIAKAREINNEFIILEGSFARKAHTKSLAASYKHTRKKLFDDSSLVDSSEDKYWVFTQNVPFQSPSTAANIVGGAALNGRLYWKIQDTGQTYAKWSEEQIEQASELVIGEDD